MGLTEIRRFGDVCTLRVATFVDALLDEVLGYGLEGDAGLEAHNVPDVGPHHAGEDGINDLEGCGGGEAG